MCSATWPVPATAATYSAARVAVELQRDEVAALDHLAAHTAERDLHAVRNLLRFLFWSMNDESGNLIRFAPQALGEYGARLFVGTADDGGFLLDMPSTTRAAAPAVRVVVRPPAGRQACNHMKGRTGNYAAGRTSGSS